MGYRIMEIVMFLPFSDSQDFESCPRPADWCFATMMVPSGVFCSDNNSAAKVLVEGRVSKSSLTVPINCAVFRLSK